ncbi:MAG: VCBS repeat-containing protein [Caldilineaceae bacterium]|nr:VCBS repeat-containing protein [Caldilineaceae bacterium]
MSELIRFSEHLIMDGYNYAYGIAAADITGNGILDIVSADTNVGLYWLENDGQGNFTRHTIHERANEWLERCAVVDINGDGRLEIVTVDNINGCLLYFAFEGDPRERQNWRHHYIIEGGLPGAYDVAVADFNGDGVLDVASSSWLKGNRFDWFEQRDGQWIQHPIEENIGETRTVCAVDIDGDGKIDLLGTARSGNQVVWYQNPGTADQPWRKTIIDDAPQPIHGHPVDMDGDGGVDVVMALGMLPPDHAHGGVAFEHHQIVWYEHTGDPTQGPWQKHIICERFPHAFEAIAADLDNDGQMEVVATAWDMTGRVALFKHRGDPRGPWDMQILKEGWLRADQVIIADLNGDGRLDIIAAAERGSNEVRWWRNEG